MSEKSLRRARICSVVAATVISISCGTNYVYSAWGPQFADRLRLSATQQNTVGLFGNVGMYGCGIPLGFLVDTKGPRPGVLLGSILLGVGYFSLFRSYNDGPGAVGVPWLCLFTFMTGAGSASAFAGSIKTSALNWPNHRGTATAFPLAAFGLSALLFSFLSSVAFPENTSDFLLLLTIGAFALPFIGQFFLRVVDRTPVYSAVPTNGERGHSPSNALHRTRSGGSKGSITHISEEPDETSSLISSSSASGPGDVEAVQDGTKRDVSTHDSYEVDIRGWTLLTKLEFYQMWLLLGMLTGIGLMTINNVGNDAQALWTHYDDSISQGMIQQRQLMHVSLLSFISFIGRLLSGIGSDLIVKNLGRSRFWCLFISSAVFCAAQICGLRIENPNLLGFLSSLSGLAYGFLFGVFPSLVAEGFGVTGLSQNWGFMTLSPVLFGNIFNLVYGRVYDHHSFIDPNGRRQCLEGLKCYQSAYWVTFAASVACICISLWAIQHDGVKKAKARRRLEADEDREA